MNELFMFIPFLKLLATDTDPGSIKQIENILQKNNIPYRIQTYSIRGVFGRQFDSASYKSSNLSMYKGASSPSMNYLIYVRRKDFEKAYSLIRTK